MKSIALLSLFLLAGSIYAQEEENIVQQLDELRINWDSNAEKLKTYAGLEKLCSDQYLRRRVIDMLDGIHHYDTLLFNVVTAKGMTDPEAKATLKDIEKLEIDYTTRAFRDFIHKECNSFNDVENNFSKGEGKEYQREIKKVEKELGKYVSEVTKQIDIVDEHAHHLDLD